MKIERMSYFYNIHYNMTNDFAETCAPTTPTTPNQLRPSQVISPQARAARLTAIEEGIRSANISPEQRLACHKAIGQLAQSTAGEFLLNQCCSSNNWDSRFL